MHSLKVAHNEEVANLLRSTLEHKTKARNLERQLAQTKKDLEQTKQDLEKAESRAELAEQLAQELV